jgi:hypothetical protein
MDMNGMSARNLRDVVAVLIEQRKTVTAQGASFAGHLIDLAIMELRLRINDVSEEELSGFCDYVGADRVEGDPVD